MEDVDIDGGVKGVVGQSIGLMQAQGSGAQPYVDDAVSINDKRGACNHREAVFCQVTIRNILVQCWNDAHEIIVV